MQQIIYFLAFGIARLIAVHAMDGGHRPNCEINARLDLAGEKPPVVLATNALGRYELAEPTIRENHDSYISLRDKKILLTCPGKRNSLNMTGNPEVMEVVASCKYTQGHNYFKIGGKDYQTDKVQCDKRVTPVEFLYSPLRCNGDGNKIKLGYKIGENFYDLIIACHRLNDGMTYYAFHMLDGSYFSKTGNSSKRPDDAGRPKFSYYNEVLYRGFPPYEYYKTDVQQKLLTQITGNPAVFDKKRGKFFSKGHLTPNADFILSTWRDVTFLYVNTAPQWQEINGGNWNELEIAVRQHAVATGKRYEVTTGTRGVLTLNGMKLFLDSARKRLPVPEYFIKTVRDMKTSQCIAFVANNFPLEEPPEHKCEDVCLQYGWPDLKDHKKAGYVYCCSYEGLVTAFPGSLPVDECGGGVLKYQGILHRVGNTGTRLNQKLKSKLPNARSLRGSISSDNQNTDSPVNEPTFSCSPDTIVVGKL